MNRRERALAAIEFRTVDKPALDIDVSEVGLHEHGEKLRDLLRTVEGDFKPISDFPIPVIPKEALDPQGRYHEFRKDAWGVEWEYRIFKMHGHPHWRPLDDLANLASYKPAPPVYPAKGTEAFDYWFRTIAESKRTFFRVGGWIGTFEVLHALRRFEDVLAEIVEEDPGIVRLADMIEGVMAQDVRNVIDIGFDMVQYAEDFGTQCSMLISPETYRSFFKPRQARLVAPAKAAGRKVFMHCCGYALPILEDYKAIGVDALWPQLTAYDLKELASACRSIGLAVAIHPDRAQLMTKGTPDQIRREIHRYAETFRPWEGGSWFYIEIDNGFPYENIRALVEALSEYRN